MANPRPNSPRPDASWFQFAHSVVTSADGCPEERPFGAMNNETDEIDGCYPTEAEAQSACDGMDMVGQPTAFVPTDAGLEEPVETPAEEAAEPTEVRMYAILCVEGVDTGDGRMLDVGGWDETSARLLPLPAWVMDEQSMWGHEGAFIGGRWDSITRLADGRRLYAEGWLSTGDDRGEWAEEQVRLQNLRFVSIDMGDADVEYEIREMDSDGWPLDVLMHFTRYELMGATICGMPALAYAVVWLDGMDPPAEATIALPPVPPRVLQPIITDEGSEDTSILILATPEPQLVIASASPDDPPESWFAYSDEHREIEALVADTDHAPHVRVFDGRRIVGFIAPFGVCHIGMPGCVTAPHSRTDYAYFATQEALARCCEGCDDAEPERRIPAGMLTMGTVHASLELPASEARHHYDHSGFAIARVAIGECDFGIWFAGAILPGVDPDRIAMLNGSNISGDWRLQRGSLELIAAMVCNVPGFPMTRPTAHFVASGRELVQTALVGPVWPGEQPDGIAASGRGRWARQDPRWAEVNRRMARIEAELARVASVADPLRPQAAEVLRATIANNGVNV